MENNKELNNEIAGISIEEMRAVYFDADALKEPAYRLYQLNRDGWRMYYRFDQNDEPIFYPSVTTVIRHTMPTSPWLINWVGELGTEAANEKRDLAASYGTFMHGQFETLAINRRYNIDVAREELRRYMERENLPEKFYGDSLSKIRKDILSFAQFLIDYKVQPVAVEVALYSSKGYAGLVDLVCYMTDPKKGERYIAIVDFKSGRKGFYEDHEIQLGMYRDMWNENFPSDPVTRIFNFAPKDWRKSPTYNLKEQTGAESLAKIPYLLEIAAIDAEDEDKTLIVVGGEIDLDNGIEANYEQVSISEIVKRRRDEADTPQEAENDQNNGLLL